VIAISLKLKPEDKLLKPYLDLTFKAIFASGTEEANTALCTFLTAAIGREVAEITILQNEPPVASAREKQIRYDIRCQFDSGETANVEIQVSSMAGLLQRIEYYASKLLLFQGIKGYKYEKLQKTYQITLLVGFNLFSDEHVIHRFEFYDKEHNVSLNGNIKILTGELQKLVEMEDIERLKPLERWLIWLRDVQNPEKVELINKLIEKEEGIEMATKTLVRLSMDESARLKAEQEEKILMDYQNDMLTARDEGIEQGIEQGVQQGIEQGVKETARNLLNMGLSVDQIAQATGLSIQEINALS
jgi:predicted transposase/invertase (TIGR01784 family)